MRDLLDQAIELGEAGVPVLGQTRFEGSDLAGQFVLMRHCEVKGRVELGWMMVCEDKTCCEVVLHGLGIAGNDGFSHGNCFVGAAHQRMVMLRGDEDGVD